MNISNGGSLNTHVLVGGHFGEAGSFSPSAGIVRVEDPGSQLSAASIFIGNYGDGKLFVSQGGSVANQYTVIGAERGGTGKATVSGAGSQWTMTGDMNVGGYGSGELLISDRGQVTTGSITRIAAFGSSSVGLVHVKDPGSIWDIANDLSMGSNGGQATLTVSDEGEVRANFITVAQGAGSTANVNIGGAAGAAADRAGTLAVSGLRFGAGNGQLNFNHTDSSGAYAFSVPISGSGAINHVAGHTRLNGASPAFNGAIVATGGTLLVDSMLNLGSSATVGAGAALGGIGQLGNVSIQDGGILLGRQGEQLSMNSLVLNNGSQVNVQLGAPGSSSLFDVAADLTLAGSLNISDLGGFGAGVYRLFDYGGALTNNGMTIGSTPVGTNASDLYLVTSVLNQVNLSNATGVTLNYWDGPTGHLNGVIDGGAGVWNTSNTNWTDNGAVIHGAWNPGNFAVFHGVGGNVTVEAGAPATIGGMQFAVDGYAIDGAAIELANAETVIRVGDGTSAGAGTTAIISAELTGTGAMAKTDYGTLVLSGGANSYAGGTTVRGGVLEISADGHLGAAAGELTLDNAALRTTASLDSSRTVNLAGTYATIDTANGTTLSLTGAMSGPGSLVKDGAGTLALDGATSYTGGTFVRDGTLRVNSQLGGNMDVLAGARLEGNGTVGHTSNAGVIAPGSSIGTLTIAGDYEGAGGALHLETVLDGDASPTDRLVITGDVSGTTQVVVTNRGGAGAQTVNGIKVIEIGGVSPANAFALAGDFVTADGQQAVVAGAYAYTLQHNSPSLAADGDWYLTSALSAPEPGPNLPGSGAPGGQRYQPGAVVYEQYPQVLAALNTVPTLQQRVGNRYGSQGAEAGGQSERRAVWARIEGGHTAFDASRSTTATRRDVDVWKLQTGIDFTLHEGKNGASLVGGINGLYGTANAGMRSAFGRGKVDATGAGLGATLTWYGADGFYVDGQAQSIWFDSDISSSTLGRKLSSDNTGHGYALSVETGKRFGLGNGYSVTPQMQLVYSSVDFDSFNDPFDAQVSLRDADSLRGRFGLAVDHEAAWGGTNGKQNRSHVFGSVNLYNEFLQGSTVSVAGVDVASRDERLWAGIGVGGTYEWNNGAYALYATADLASSTRNFGDNYSFGGTVGMRVRW
ncbi:outer membrane autotransporter [Achromobacter arsenitoxydans SY8]|uniref:Outer membrane autotransporter n=1 Tax=Achromobacter arsenitoxydans SY8 TaxID=477184 RepID=H0FEI2_9BURK|nr:outer membrane autotransporter [Achromobacter arsenitoxydans SY8]